jgi:hypothetical protein
MNILNHSEKLKAFLFSAYVPISTRSGSSSSTKSSGVFGVTIHDLLYDHKASIRHVDEMREAIENMGAMWDYLIDGSGDTKFMRTVLANWLTLLDKRSLTHIRAIPLDALLLNFSTYLLQFTKEVNRPDAHDLPRLTLQQRFEQAFMVDDRKLMMSLAASTSSLSFLAPVSKGGSTSSSSGSVNRDVKQSGYHPYRAQYNISKKTRGGVNTPTNSSLCFAHLPYALKIANAAPCASGGNCFRMHDISDLSKKELTDYTVSFGGKYKQAVQDIIKKMS